MKKTIGIFLFITNIMFVYAQSWTNAVTSLTIGSNQSFTSTTDRNGIHILYYTNGALKYGRINSAGTTVVSDVTVATGIGNYAAVTTYNDKIYAVYEKNTDVYIAKSTDGGSNWTSPIGEYSRTNSFSSLSATSDFNGVHVVWAEYAAGVNEAYYALATVGDPSPNWLYFKEVSDYSNHTGVKPTVAVSANEVHVTYLPAGSGYAQSRDFLISQGTPTWENPVTLESGGYVPVDARTVVIGNTVNVIGLEYVSFYGGGSYIVKHYNRSVSATSFSSSTLTDEYYNGSPNLHMVSTNNGNLHLFYNKRFYNTSAHYKFDGSSWSSVANNLVWNNRNHVSAAGNDLFLVQEDVIYSDKLSLRQYDAAPTAPTTMSIGAPNQVTVNWAYNPEPDIQSYEVWRKYWRSSRDNQDWTLKATPTTNSWTDPDFQLNSEGNIYTVYYKTKVKDVANQYSAYSGEATTSAYFVFSKYGALTADLTIPSEYGLKQNYPNPFNPSTTISFGIPEPTKVMVAVYDEIGREIAMLVNNELMAGTYSAKFDASKLSSGIYFVKMSAGKFTATKKIMLMK